MAGSRFRLFFGCFWSQTLMPMFIFVVHVLQVHLPKEGTVELLHFGVFLSFFFRVLLGANTFGFTLVYLSHGTSK